MTLLFIDGFDHYSTAQFPDKGYNYGLAIIDSSAARFSGKGVRINSSTSYWVRKNIGINKSTIYMGIAVQKAQAGTIGYNTSFPLITFEDEALVKQIKIFVNSALGIDVYRGDDSLLGSSADSIFLDQRWQYIEVKVTISDTVGVVEIKINETQVLNLTSQDTKNGSDYIRYIDFKCFFNSIDAYYDDFYVDDAQFHGDCRIRTFMPDLDGNSADFTRSAGANDYECVDESPSTEDTDYISSNTLNHKSIFGITSGAVGTVKGIQVNNHCRIDEAGTRKIKPIVRSNATDYQGVETDLIAAGYFFEHEIWELDPDDSGAWTQTKLEAAEFGLEITT